MASAASRPVSIHDGLLPSSRFVCDDQGLVREESVRQVRIREPFQAMRVKEGHDLRLCLAVQTLGESWTCVVESELLYVDVTDLCLSHFCSPSGSPLLRDLVGLLVPRWPRISRASFSGDSDWITRRVSRVSRCRVRCSRAHSEASLSAMLAAVGAVGRVTFRSSMNVRSPSIRVCRRASSRCARLPLRIHRTESGAKPCVGSNALNASSSSLAKSGSV